MINNNSEIKNWQGSYNLIRSLRRYLWALNRGYKSDTSKRKQRSRSFRPKERALYKGKYGDEGPVEDQRKKKVGLYDICLRGRGGRGTR